MNDITWKMWRSGFDSTKDIDQAYFVYIENEEIYEDFCDFYEYSYEVTRGVEGTGMWVWSSAADMYLNYEDCLRVVNDMNRFEQNVGTLKEI